MSILPLDASEFDQIDSHQSAAERRWRRIPVLGWMIADKMWIKRNRPLRNRLCEALEKREPTAEQWNGDELGARVCEVAKKEMGWPNAHFIPQDPFRLVFWAFDDGLDLEFAMMEIGDSLDIEIRREDVLRHYEGTLGEFVTALRHPENFGEKSDHDHHH